MTDRETGFVGRPTHTQAEDWVVYHPKMTPTALMLYMRLRGAVMDPASRAEDWKKAARFTHEQMRRLLPRTKVNGKEGASEDPYASERTVRGSIALLVEIGALRKVKVKGGQPPVYDFPMHPPKGHTGPMRGVDVASDLRKYRESRKSTESDQTPGNTLPGVQETRQYTAVSRGRGGNTLPGTRQYTAGSQGSDLRPGGTEEVFKEESLSLEEGPAAPGEGEKPLAAPAGSPLHTDIPHAVEEALEGLQGDLSASEEDEVAEFLVRAAESGLPPLRAVRFLNGKIGGGVNNVGALHISVLRKQGLPRPRKSDHEDWMNQVCADCNMDGRLANGRMCHHGQARVNGVGMKECSGCQRRIPARAADPCARCQRTGS